MQRKPRFTQSQQPSSFQPQPQPQLQSAANIMIRVRTPSGTVRLPVSTADTIAIVAKKLVAQLGKEAPSTGMVQLSLADKPSVILDTRSTLATLRIRFTTQSKLHVC